MISVASVPSAHTYVQNSSAGSKAVLLLTDPTPVGSLEPGRWWPPRYLDPQYLTDHIDELDVLHVHFGFESIGVSQLRSVVQVLRRHGRPLVLTVHDLHNPHFADNTEHRLRLDVLVPAADAVITLTDHAAAEIYRTWGRRAIVLPHPHVLPMHVIGADRTPRERPVIGLHAKSLRANIDPESVLPHLVDAAEAVGATVRLDIDDTLFDRDGMSSAAERLLAYRDDKTVDVRVHRRFDDDDFRDYLTAIDVSVLPYRFGTHSGWMEACRDVGTRVVVPDVGHFRHQFECDVFRFGDGASIRRAVAAAVHRAPAAPSAIRSDREASRRRSAEVLESAYRQAIARASSALGSTA